MPGPWRRWAGFVRRPSLPDKADPAFLRGVKTVLPLLALDLLLMAVLLGAVGAATALGFEMPEHMLGEMTLSAPLVVFFVVGAPSGEEILFRGWLSGRTGHILGALAFAAAIALFLMGGRNAAMEGAELWSFAALALLVVSALVVFLLRGRPALAGFKRRFAWFYWISAVAFAAIHLTNFAAAGPSMLPLVLPQFALALLLGYLRVTHGLWSAIMLHMLHNATFMAFVLIGTAAA
ncbi:CPBP family glutamic-type intramembrane protease [Tsuneonella sp. HG249]